MLFKNAYRTALLTLSIAVGLAGPAAAVLPEDAVFVPGSTPLDTAGLPIQAHGGGIIKVNSTFFWYGESYKRPLLGDFLSEGVNMYSSTDLMVWQFEGLVFNATRQMRDMPVEPPFRLERPKILYNEAYGAFVLLFHADTPTFSYSAVGVAIAGDVRGPYRWVRVFQPDGLPSLDMGVFQEADNSAYLIRSVNNKFIGISQLTPNYTDTTGIISVAPRVEGPAVFKPTSKDYFLMASSMTYWDPNPPLMFHASAAALHGAHWHSLPTPAQGPGANITYNSQSSFIFPLDLADGTRLFIYMGDRWNFASPGSVANASYVWLPLLPRTDGQPGYALQSLDRWRPKDFRQQARLPVSVEPEGISAVEQAWMDITYAPSTQSQRTGTVSAIAT